MPDKYELTDEHREMLAPWAEKWIKNAMSTEAMTEEERDGCREAVAGIYKAAGLEPPSRVVFTSSPMAAHIASGLAATIWYLRNRQLLTEATHTATLDATRTATRAATYNATYGAIAAATFEATNFATNFATNDETNDAVYTSTVVATSAATRAATFEATRTATRAATYNATYGAIAAATFEATEAATFEATSAATRDATNDATRDATNDATRDATNDATEAATRAAIEAATYGATRAATLEATRTATLEATRTATRAATEAATSAATLEATNAATFEATFEATDAATNAATFEATDAATSDATYDAVATATNSVTIAATRDVVHDATRAATYNATRAATRDAIYNATRDEINFATHTATRAATRDAVATATRAATRDATEVATRDVVDAVLNDKWYAGITEAQIVALSDKFGLGKLGLEVYNKTWRLRQGGNQWSAFESFLSFFTDIVGLETDTNGGYAHWLYLARHSGVRYIHDEFCIISDRPELLTVDDQHRPHNETGPFSRWRDGFALYAWHGTYVPAWFIEQRHKLTPSIALSQTNAELRRAACEIIGWDKVLEHESLNPRVINEDLPHIGTLISVDLPDAADQWFLKYKCGTGRWFAEAVNDKSFDTALKANAGGNGWRGVGDPHSFIPFIRS